MSRNLFVNSGVRGAGAQGPFANVNGGQVAVFGRAY